MYSILFTILLASTYVSAIPMPLELSVQVPVEIKEGKENKEKFTAALKEANEQIGRMGHVLAKDPNHSHIETAFGPNANRKEIKDVVEKLATKEFVVQSMDPDLSDTVAGGLMPNKADKNGKYPLNGLTLGFEKPSLFGSVFFAGSNTEQNTKQRAGTIIHEATHQLAGAGDHVDYTTNKVIPIGKPVSEHAKANEGYSDNLNPPTKSTLGSKYENMRDTISNTHQNADSYRVFAALCSQPLHKRALLEDDPVGYYLSKRSQCNLPPNYFAKKAAASKGTTAAATGTTSPTAVNRKAGTFKSTSAKGAKDLQGGVKGTSTRKSTGATAGKGLKTVKGTKAAKGLKTAKGAKTAKGLETTKAGKGLKAPKGAKVIKGVKAAKGAKTIKGTKSAKGLKTTKEPKTVKELKKAKTGQGVKASKGTKSVKVTHTSTGVKFAKPVKAANRAKGTKGTGSSKLVQATKSPKSTAARGAKTAGKVATKVTGRTAVKATVPKAAVKVAAAVPKKRKNPRRDLGMMLDESD